MMDHILIAFGIFSWINFLTGFMEAQKQLQTSIDKHKEINKKLGIIKASYSLGFNEVKNAIYIEVVKAFLIIAVTYLTLSKNVFIDWQILAWLGVIFEIWITQLMISLARQYVESDDTSATKTQGNNKNATS